MTAALIISREYSGEYTAWQTLYQSQELFIKSVMWPQIGRQVATNWYTVGQNRKLGGYKLNFWWLQIKLKYTAASKQYNGVKST